MRCPIRCHHRRIGRLLLSTNDRSGTEFRVGLLWFDAIVISWTRWRTSAGTNEKCIEPKMEHFLLKRSRIAHEIDVIQKHFLPVFEADQVDERSRYERHP